MKERRNERGSGRKESSPQATFRLKNLREKKYPSQFLCKDEKKKRGGNKPAAGDLKRRETRKKFLPQKKNSL